MALTTETELKERIAQQWEEYGPTPYDSDFIAGFTETELPIYYNQIIDQWVELPSDYRDTWQDIGITEMTTITKLMTWDLYNYYHDTASRLLTEIQEKQEDDNA